MTELVRLIHSAMERYSGPDDSEAEAEFIADAIAEALGNDHYAVIKEDGWAVEHSVECRLKGNLTACSYHAAVARAVHHPDGDLIGRWRIKGISGNGKAVLERA